MLWHQREIKDTILYLRSSIDGLSSEEAKKRLKEYGFNELKEKKKRTPALMFLDQFKDFLIIILIISAVIAGIVGKPTDAMAIVVIVFLNAIIGFIQEYRAEKAMAALKKMAAPTAIVLRDNSPTNIQASEIVPGDIVLLEAGQIVPADIRLIESINLKIEESVLTGESFPVEKNIAKIEAEQIPIGERKNISYQGTTVVYGRGKGLVFATGMETEMGKIASMLQGVEDVKTPLQRRLAVFGKNLAIVILAICAIIFLAGIIRGENVVLMFLTAIALAVAAIPEALPAVITISLAIGARKMVKQNALIRKLPAVETLGSVTYICSDKTGTLTLNKMTVEKIYIDGKITGANVCKCSTNENNIPHKMLLYALALSNDVQVDAQGNIIGDPTEIALYNVAKDNNFDKKKLEKEFQRVAEIPFDSNRKCMTTFHNFIGEKGEKFVSFTKGAIDTLIENTKDTLTSFGLSYVNKEDIYEINNEFARCGLRVLYFAMREWNNIPEDISPENVETQLTLLGLVGMMDPPRDEAKDAVKMCKSAGIRPVMITGDHLITAREIANQIKILEDGQENIITGEEMDKLSLREFEEKVEHISVYARVAPEHKFKIVKALQDRGHLVAMTGDGVNDAPALKQADIGVAMGITGTAVSKEASSMILLDDNFATIVKAVQEGRRIYDNILKFITYSITSNAGTVWAIFLAPFFGLPLPLIPIQILWMNLLCDGLPGLSLTTEPSEKTIMNRPPRHPQESVFANGRGWHIIKFGLLIGVAVLLFQWFAMKENMPWQTMVFAALVLSRMAVVMAVRSDSNFIHRIGFFTNKPLVIAIVFTVALQMVVVYVPYLHPIFKTVSLSPEEILFTIAFAIGIFFLMEMGKIFKK